MWWRYSYSSPRVTFLQAPFSLEHFSIKMCPALQTGNLRHYDSSLPFTQHTQSCANPAVGFISAFQNPFFHCHACYTPFHFSQPDYIGLHTFPVLASTARRYSFLLPASKKLHSTLLRPCFPHNLRLCLPLGCPLPPSYVIPAASAHL